MVSFQPLEAVQKLRDAGVDEPQATATVEVVGDAASDLVTRDYLDGRFDQLEARLDARFAEQHSELQVFRSDIDVRFAEQRAEAQVFRSDMDVRFAEQGADFSRALLMQTSVVLAAVVTINVASVSVALLLADRLFQ